MDYCQDSTKSGEDSKRLWNVFEQLQRKHGKEVDLFRHAPTDELRAMVPEFEKYTQRERFRIDEDLSVRSCNESLWNKYYEEGKDVMRTFNQKLREAINQDSGKG